MQVEGHQLRQGSSEETDPLLVARHRSPHHRVAVEFDQLPEPQSTGIEPSTFKVLVASLVPQMEPSIRVTDTQEVWKPQRQVLHLHIFGVVVTSHTPKAS